MKFRSLGKTVLVSMPTFTMTHRAIGIVMSLILNSNLALSQDRIQIKTGPETTSILKTKPRTTTGPNVFLVVLGNAQDAGYPQAECKKKCCQPAWENHRLRRFATSIAIVDQVQRSRLLFECTPNFPEQMRLLDEYSALPSVTKGHTPAIASLDAIFLTHAHIGHYAGLIHLGREVIGAKGIPVYVMPRMRKFLIANGPWSQLVQLKNVLLRPLMANEPSEVGRIKVTPMVVPHRDEFSETVGFRIEGPNRSALFLPDIDKWEKWDRKIEDEIKKVDIALIDGTFFGDGELPGRNMSEIPHPFIEESLERFAGLQPSQKKKIYFIHMNHTNLALQKESNARRKIISAGFHVADQGMKIGL